MAAFSAAWMHSAACVSVQARWTEHLVKINNEIRSYLENII